MLTRKLMIEKMVEAIKHHTKGAKSVQFKREELPQVLSPEEMSPTQRSEFDYWLSSRPVGVRDLILDHPPWHVYLLNGKPCQISAYNENGTFRVLTVNIFGQLYSVFGVEPEDLQRET